MTLSKMLTLAELDVGRVNLLLVCSDVDHVRPVLSGAHDPIDLRGGRIVTGHAFRPFCREPKLAANKG